MLKASDVDKDVLDNIATKLGHIYDFKKKELDVILDAYKLGEPRYMGKDQRPDFEILYSEATLHEKNKE